MSLWPTTGRYFHHLTILGKALGLEGFFSLAGTASRHHSAAREHPSGLLVTKKVEIGSGTKTSFYYALVSQFLYRPGLRDVTPLIGIYYEFRYNKNLE